MLKLVILDLDKTIWDHEDASSLKPPFKKRSNDEMVDSEGTIVKLNSGVKKFLRTCKDLGIYVSLASWNKPIVAIQLLDKFEILGYFQNPVIEFHPEKDRMVNKILNKFKNKGLNFRQGEIAFIDDNPDMIAKVKAKFPKIKTVLFGVEVSTFQELKTFMGIQ